MNIKKENFRVLISEEKIKERIKEMGKEISEEYKGKEIILICVLKGSMYFTVDLSKYIESETIIDCIRVLSYNGTKSTGKINLKMDLDENIEGKNVIVIEDIIDTGRTLSYLLDYLKTKKPNSIKLCTLLDKPERREFNVKVDYIGFQIPDKFVIGYGLDYNEKYRNLPYIAYVEE